MTKTILIFLLLFIGAFPLHDYLHTLHINKHSEETAHHGGQQDHAQDSSCDCFCICDLTLLNKDFIYNHEIDFIPTYISIQHEPLPPSPFLNPLERPPQTA